MMAAVETVGSGTEALI